MLGIAWAVVQVLVRKRFVLLYLVVPTFFYLGMSMTSHLNIGVRHILPVFPFVALAGAGFLSTIIEFGLERRKTLVIAIVVVVLVGNLVIAVFTFPNYLTYFSPLAGGASQGWQMLSDSNVETGQEVKSLAKYLKDRGQNRVTGIMVGAEFLRFYGIQLDEFPGWEAGDDSDNEDDNDAQSANINTKYVAIGAWYMSETDLSDEQKQIIDAYRNQQPEAMVGNSIFVFRRH